MRTCQQFPGNIKGKILPDMDGPFYERYLKTIHFNTGDITGPDAASGIIITGVGIKSRAVGMSGNQDTIMLLGPGGKSVFDLLLFWILFRTVRRIQKTDTLKRTPEVPDQKSCLSPQNAVEEVCLMSVGQIEIRAAGLISQDQSREKPDAGK